MIADSSAVLAIVCREPGCEEVLGRLRETGVSAAGTPTLAETGIVLQFEGSDFPETDRESA